MIISRDPGELRSVWVTVKIQRRVGRVLCEGAGDSDM